MPPTAIIRKSLFVVGRGATFVRLDKCLYVRLHYLLGELLSDSTALGTPIGTPRLGVEWSAGCGMMYGGEV